MAPTVALAPAVAAFAGAAAWRLLVGASVVRVAVLDDSDVAVSDVAREDGVFDVVPGRDESKEQFDKRKPEGSKNGKKETNERKQKRKEEKENKKRKKKARKKERNKERKNERKKEKK